MSLKIGALFAGYGGLDMAVMHALDAQLAWYAEWEQAPAKVMAHHHPDVPNLWDVTKVDWAAVEPVDIITGGSPCQDLSHAGKRKGMTDGTRSNLWAEMREAIAVHRPRLVVWENVRGAYSASADSDLEPCTRCVGGAHDRGPVLRALGRVLGDLAELGYDARWYGLRAANVGAAHGRFRVFVIAAPRDAPGGGVEGLRPRGVEVSRAHDGAGLPLRSGTDAASGLTLLSTPRTSDTNGAGAHGQGGPDLRTVVDLLPTPRATRGGSATETTALLPTPRATDGTKGGPNQRGSSGDLMLPSAVQLLPTPNAGDAKQGYVTREQHHARERAKKAANPNLGGLHADLAFVAQTTEQWGDYAAAIARWENVTGRPAPEPTEPNAKGGRRLSPLFVEWLMGLPAGHVTDSAIGISRNDQLKALGNGVVWQQAAAALTAYIHDEQQGAA